MKPPTCSTCPLYTQGKGWVPPEGKLTHGVLILGEAPGEEEALSGKPFVGASGQFLNRLIGRINDPLTGLPLRREDFMVANILRCQPPGNFLTKAPYEFDAIRNCSPYLREWLLQNRNSIRAIIAMDNQPLRWLTSRWGIDDLRGYVWASEFAPVVGTYHPSYLLRGNFELSRVVQQDILKALLVAREGAGSLVRRKTYLCDPTPMVFAEWCKKYDGTSPLAFDIETPYSDEKDKAQGEEEESVIEDDPSYTILRISFSYTPFEAVSVPWVEPYITLAKELLATPGSWKLVHNAKFDVPRLHNAGVLFGGVIVDNMDAWHYMEPALPMGLKWIATLLTPDMEYWKDLTKANPAWYSAADSDVLLRCFLSIKARLERESRWEAFDRQFIQLRRVLDKMSFRGVPTDAAIRKEGVEYFSKRFERVVQELQPLTPPEVRKKKIYKSKEEKLKKEGKWMEGRMTQIMCMEPAPKTWWWLVDLTGGMENAPLLGRVKSATREEALELGGKKWPGYTLEARDSKPPKPPKVPKEKKPRRSAKKSTKPVKGVEEGIQADLFSS